MRDRVQGHNQQRADLRDEQQQSQQPRAQRAMNEVQCAGRLAAQVILVQQFNSAMQEAHVVATV